MSEAPERIWAFEDEPGGIPRGGWWCDEQSECPNGSPEYIRAGLVPAPSVTVKPLEWEEGAAGYFFADDFGHTWRIHPRRGQFACYKSGGTDLGTFASVTAAKAAAQADYEARILAAVQIDPALGWRNIETAPRDQIVLLAWLYRREWQYEAGLAGSTRGGWWHGQATHWMPLPAPPSDGVEP